MSLELTEKLSSAPASIRCSLLKQVTHLLEGTDCTGLKSGKSSPDKTNSGTCSPYSEYLESDVDLFDDLNFDEMSRKSNRISVLLDGTNSLSKSDSSIPIIEQKVPSIRMKKKGSIKSNKENAIQTEAEEYEIVDRDNNEEISSCDEFSPKKKGRRETILIDDYEVISITPERKTRNQRKRELYDESLKNTPRKSLSRVVKSPTYTFRTSRASVANRKSLRLKKSPKFYGEDFESSTEWNRTPSPKDNINSTPVYKTRNQKRKDSSKISKTSVATPKKSSTISTITPPRTPKNRETPVITLRKSSIRTKKSQVYESSPPGSDSDEQVFRTPRKKTKTAPVTPVTPSTPKTRVKNLLPMLPSRLNSPSTPMTPKIRALAALHTTSVPDSLPCREEEFKTIYNFVYGSMKNLTGGYMYIHGMPGVGKTATVKRVIDKLQKECVSKKLKPFVLVDINGADSRRPKDVYCKIWQQITNEKLSEKRAQISLQKTFNQSKSSSGKIVFLVIDEFDFLSSKRQNVIYDILEWATSPKLTVLAIANTHNLLEKIKDAAKAKSRENQELRSIGFSPYTSQQLKTIIIDRLKGYDIFTSDAVELLARKAANKGDARTALNLCRRVLTVVQEAPEGLEKISITKVNEILRQVHSTPLHIFIRKNLSEHDQFILRAIRDVLLNSGGSSCSIDGGVFHHYKALCTLDSNVTALPEMDLLLRIHSLRNYGLIKISDSFVTINSDINLLIEPEDVQLALLSQEHL